MNAGVIPESHRKDKHFLKPPFERFPRRTDKQGERVRARQELELVPKVFLRPANATGGVSSLHEIGFARAARTNENVYARRWPEVERSIGSETFQLHSCNCHAPPPLYSCA